MDKKLRTVHRSMRHQLLSLLIPMLIPMLVPLLILGSLSTFLIKLYIQGQIDTNNKALLSQTKSYIELSFREVDSLSTNFSANPGLTVTMKDILKTGQFTDSNFDLLKVIRNFVDSTVYANPFIYSVYIYFDNDDQRFLSSVTGLNTADKFYDHDWYALYKNHSNERVWTENRIVKGRAPDKGTRIISIYNRLRLASGGGVVVLNVKADYIESQLRQLPAIDSQCILLMDEHNRIIAKSADLDYLKSFKNDVWTSKDPLPEEMKIDGRTYKVDTLSSSRFGWKYVSIVPKAALYSLPNKLSMLTGLLLLISTLIGLFLSYSLSKRKNQTLQTVVSILHAAEHGTPLPQVAHGAKSDIYGYITENIVKKFIENEFLTVQLSERKYRLQVMEFIALHAQLNPHFLYNTLETIYWKVASYTGKPNEANEMIENLSGVLRYSLDSSVHFVPLQEEVKNTMRYVDIQNIRYKEKFDVIWQIDEAAAFCNVMKLILQPILENSIIHGVRMKTSKSIIRIKAELIGDHMRLTVTDTGVGMEKPRRQEVVAKLASEIEGGRHIGLLNTHKRLTIRYGEQYGIKILSKKGLGTSISMTFPVQKQMETVYES
ncbi:histidine kinase [Paenibacillus baekrokdamisoli]|uniref:Histidine kinase n=1 Tax=Paenibacillus baekrokdamisoli TaxID=1712516 RepID=A0A3G9JAJ8_9BACL|nr:histidine kinase [Paenibacillus baekrokdamisoli]MBB3071575.1 two-component system sensor histidine kinase YesM [Paenibacillus baekrokdamisoli]BBH21913.1 histidine kinase [Paenibacillus baekrokdamisoli]